MKYNHGDIIESVYDFEGAYTYEILHVFSVVYNGSRSYYYYDLVDDSRCWRLQPHVVNDLEEGLSVTRPYLNVMQIDLDFYLKKGCAITPNPFLFPNGTSTKTD